MSEGSPSASDDEVVQLSAEQIERRLGGRAALASAGGPSPGVDGRGLLARDTLTILGAVLAAVLGWQLLGGFDAGAAGGRGSPPAETGIVVGSLGTIPTIPPLETLGPIVNPRVGVDASPTPVPFATLGPTTLTIVVKVVNDNGGTAQASDWTISISGGAPSKATFPGSASGTTVTIEPGTSFTITTRLQVSGGYTESRSGRCSGPIPKGLRAVCTITEDDEPAAPTASLSL